MLDGSAAMSWAPTSRRKMTATPTSEKLIGIEDRLRAAFTIHEAKALTLPIPATVRPDASPGEIIAAMTKNAAMAPPIEVVKQWGEAFRADVDTQLAALDSIREEGAMWKGVVDFLRGKAAFPPHGTPPDIRASAMTLAAATDKSLALATARRIELAVDDQIAELDRMKSVWGEKSSLAADIVIAKKTAAYLDRCGDSANAEIYARKHAKLAEQRAAMGKRARRERDHDV